MLWKTMFVVRSTLHRKTWNVFLYVIQIHSLLNECEIVNIPGARSVMQMDMWDMLSQCHFAQPFSKSMRAIRKRSCSCCRHYSMWLEFSQKTWLISLFIYSMCGMLHRNTTHNVRMCAFGRGIRYSFLSVVVLEQSDELRSWQFCLLCTRFGSDDADWFHAYEVGNFAFINVPHSQADVQCSRNKP